MKKRPNILLTNDDGIEAPGLKALAQAMESVGDLTVVAPAAERSAVGHAITLSDPLRVAEYSVNGRVPGFSVNGTPADCVKIAVWALLKNRPDLVVSGINLGSNTGINTIYSGTVSAATEGAILGIPSFAVSLATFKDPDFQPAAGFSVHLSRLLLKSNLPEGVYLNVNVPNGPADTIRGVAVTRQGLSVFKERFHRRSDPRGRTYYWLSGQKVNVPTDPDVDEGAVNSGYISVTPVHYDLTRYDFLDTLKSWPLHV